jgi:uncharacterized protein YkwD
MMTTQHRIRRGLAALVAAASLFSLLALDAPAQARTTDATTSSTTRATARAMTRNQSIVVGQINRARRARDRRAIATNGLMNQRAMKWAAHLRACQCLQHRAAPYGLTRGWCAAAENVGRSGDGGTLGGVHNAFMNSSGHRSNILNARWTDLGVGVARDRRGEYFVVHVFADYSC